VTTRQNYIDFCQEHGTDPVEHENQVLSIGSEYLPAYARRVRDGKKATAAYWRWLTEQLLA
jgi:hypothetical protein